MSSILHVLSLFVICIFLPVFSYFVFNFTSFLLVYFYKLFYLYILLCFYMLDLLLINSTFLISFGSVWEIIFFSIIHEGDLFSYRYRVLNFNAEIMKYSMNYFLLNIPDYPAVLYSSISLKCVFPHFYQACSTIP